MTINNPYVPGDPFSYDLKWIVRKIKEHQIILDGLDERIQNAIIAALENLDQLGPKYFESAADLISSDLKDKSIAYIEGFYSPADGGANLYYVTTDYNDIIGSNFYLTLDGPNRWALPIIVTPYVTPEMFGAYGDGTNDDYQAFVNALNYNVVIYVGKKKYKLSDTLELTAYSVIEGMSRSPFDDNGSTIIGNGSDPVIKTESHVTVENINIRGGSVGILVDGARGYFHSISIQDCVDGIVAGSSSNWTPHTTFERISIYNVSGTGIKIEDANSQNSQDMSFYDIDIVMAGNGIDTYQPGNRFYNVAVHNTASTGKGIILEAGANNNAFYGTYLENNNALADVDFTTSKYNQFTGCRPYQYELTVINNDGTNTFEIVTNNNPNARILLGRSVFETVGIPLRKVSGQYGSFAAFQRQSDNTLKLGVNNDTAPVYLISDVLFNENHITHTGFNTNQKFTNLTLYEKKITYASLPVGGSNGQNIYDVDSNAIIAIANCTTPGVWCNCVPQSNALRLIAHNDSANDLSNIELTFHILLATKA